MPTDNSAKIAEVNVYSQKMVQAVEAEEGMEVYLHSFFTSATR